MAKKYIPRQKEKYQELNKRLNKYSALVQSLYDKVASTISPSVISSGYDGDKPFSLKDYPEVRSAMEEAQVSFAQDMKATILRGTAKEWAESNLVQDLLADGMLKFYGATIRGEKFKSYYEPNNDALKAFQERKLKGLDLSQKIWNQSVEMRSEMECCLSTSIEKGISAVTLSKRLSKYLADYDLLKEHYKEKYGKAATCNDCEYRSMRLARSEINMAYRTAEQKRWEQMDFIIGYEIKTTQNGNHVSDVCDELKGKYPKDFEWTGWHPNCRCYKIPILKTEEEFWADEDGVQGINEVAENNETEESFKKLKENGFKLTDTFEDYKESPLKDFDITGFDNEMSSILSDIGIDDAKKRLSAYGNTASITYSKGDFDFIIKYRRDSNGVIASELELYLPENAEGKNVTKRINSALFDRHKKIGVSTVEVDVDDVSSYSFAKAGYKAERNQAIKAISKIEGSNKELYDKCKSLIDEYYKGHSEEDLFPMSIIANENFGKDALANSSWKGILDLNDKDVLSYHESYLGKSKSIKTVRTKEIDEIPNNFKIWVENNMKRIEESEKRNTLPYFLKENQTIYKSIIEQAKNEPYEYLDLATPYKDNKWQHLIDVDNSYRPIASKEFLRATEAERRGVYEWTGNENKRMLVMLKNGEYENNTGNKRIAKLIKDCESYIDKCSFPNSATLRRGETFMRFNERFGLDLKDFESSPKSLKGKIGVDNAFISTALTSDKGMFTDIEMRILCPKGYKAAYVEPFSSYGSINEDLKDGLLWDGKAKPKMYKGKAEVGEMEVLLQRNSTMEIIDAEFENGKWYIYAKLK